MLRNSAVSKYVQVVLSVSIGWFVMGHLWNTQTNYNLQKGYLHSSNLEHCSCKWVQCIPCDSPPEDASSMQQKNNEIAGSYYRSYRYKPLTALEDERNRWRFLTSKFNYEMINQEPRVGLNGMWKLEVEQVESHGKNLIHDYDTQNHQPTNTGNLKLTGIHRHVDPFSGLNYIVNFAEQKPSSVLHTSVEISRWYVPGKPKLVDIKYASGSEMINIISPLSKVTERFNLFLERYEKNVLNAPGCNHVRIIFVIFVSTNEKDQSVNQIVSVVEKYKMRNPAALIDYIFTKGEFNRAVGLHTGTMQCKDDEIVLFLDVDLKIGPEFLARVRRNTIPHKRVIFPIMFSQYDPDILAKAATIDIDLKPYVSDTMNINKQTGFWIYYAYGVAAMYKSDYLKVGGFRLDIRGWGGEDVDLFKKMVGDPDLEVMHMVDPDLIHIYHKRGCDVHLSADQYAMCVGAWAETLGSKQEIATLYLHDHE